MMNKYITDSVERFSEEENPGEEKQKLLKGIIVKHKRPFCGRNFRKIFFKCIFWVSNLY